MQNLLAEEAAHQLRRNPNYKPMRRERRHRWMMRLERLFGWELSKKHYRRTHEV